MHTPIHFLRLTEYQSDNIVLNIFAVQHLSLLQTMHLETDLLFVDSEVARAVQRVAQQHPSLLDVSVDERGWKKQADGRWIARHTTKPTT